MSITDILYTYQLKILSAVKTLIWLVNDEVERMLKGFVVV
jgi:hypothetical protein